METDSSTFAADDGGFHAPSNLNEELTPPVTYDPKALLNPTASRNAKNPDTTENGAEQRGFGAGQMIENLHGITERDDVPTKKRKVQVLDDNEDEEHEKNSNATFNFNNGGIISSHLKEERKKLAAESSTSNAPEPIDLTNDDDEVQAPAAPNNDVQFIRETTTNDRVCLGVLHGTANVFRVPVVSQNAMRAFKNHWPRTKVGYSRMGTQNSVVHLVDRSGAKFGVLDLKLAAGLCPLLTGISVNKIEIKVYLVDRVKRGTEKPGDPVSQSLKVDIILDAPMQHADRIGKFLSQKQLFLSSPVVNTGKEVFNPHEPKPFGGPTRAGSQQTYASGTIGRTVEQILRETSSMFDSLTKDEDIPEMEPNQGIITSPLMEHQKKALHFLMEHERSDYDGDELSSHSLWKFRNQNNGRPSWYHVLTDQVVFEKPDDIQGGILADVMGLGKTLSILALIAETREAARRFHREEGAEDEEGVQLKNVKTTLIICPKSVLSNWQEQIRNHTVVGKFKVYTYHGTSRLQDLHELSKFEIILTSYNTAAYELTGNKSALMSIKWFRVVLDEAHSIRNSSTKISKACCALNAERRWAMTGTPVQNSLYDLGALFKFLHLEPFDSANVWGQYIMAPFKNGDVKVIEQLQILVRSVTLRRTKNTIDLPDKKVERVRLNFTKDELNLYKQFAKKAGLEFNGITKGGSILKGKAYAHILKSLGRLRAICAHGKEMLNPGDMDEILGYDPSNAIVLDLGEPEPENEDSFVTEKAAYDYLRAFFDSEADICQSCGTTIVRRDEQNTGEDVSDSEEDVEDANDGKDADDGKDLLGHLTPCYHLICAKCTDRHEKEVEATLTVDNFHTCPHCESYVQFDLYPLRQSVFDRLTEVRKEKSGRSTGAKWDETTYSGPHTKVKELLRELQQSAAETEELPPGEPPIRSVVFSGWTQYLDLIEYALDNEHIGCTRIDGSMSVKQRSQALHSFNTLDDVRVLLVSIKAGGQGLNFTSANKAYVMEPGYNPAAEHQAVDRVHRIGQTRDVTIKHFIMQNSVEEKILNLQKQKEALANLSMERKRTKGEDAKVRMEELKDLFK